MARGVWIAHSPDWSVVVPFGGELAAHRYANDNEGLKVKLAEFGADVRTLVQPAGARPPVTRKRRTRAQMLADAQAETLSEQERIMASMARQDGMLPDADQAGEAQAEAELAASAIPVVEGLATVGGGTVPLNIAEQDRRPPTSESGVSASPDGRR